MGCHFFLQSRHHESEGIEGIIGGTEGIELKELLFEEITAHVFPGCSKDIGSQNEFKQK